MATVIIYDPADPTVANRVTAYLPSANTPDFESNPNALLNPDLSGVTGANWLYWKYADPDVVEMSVSEKEAIDAVTPAPTPEVVRILEESLDSTKRTGGHYRAEGLSFNISASANIKTKNFTFPIPISILSFEYVPESTMEGDKISTLIAPNTVIGTITSDVAINDTVINVSQTVRDNLELGYHVRLDDGTNNEELGQVTAIDNGAGTITVETPSPVAYAAATPTEVKSTIYMMQDVILTGEVRMEVGATKIGGSYLPANTVIRFRYNNLSGGAKTFSGILEYLY